MTTFLRATVVAREPGAAYEDVVFDYDLRLRSADGVDFTAFDANDVGEGLAPGDEGDFALEVAAPGPVQTGAAGDEEALSATVEERGAHVTGAWTRSVDRLASVSWAILRVPGGAVLIDDRELPDDAARGAPVHWAHSRYDLIGCRLTDGG